MGSLVHQNNVLLELAKTTTFGWVKELCFRTLENGVLDANGIQSVFDLFVSRSVNASSATPVITPEQELRLVNLEHAEGVNALKAGERISFCEEGVTLIYGQNGSGKSGYYRTLENLAGGRLAEPVIRNIYEERPSTPRCRFNYKLNGVVQPLFDWDNSSLTSGRDPFNKITVFDSKYTNYLVKKHSPDTYLLSTHGFFDFSDFEINKDSLIRKVQTECPDRETELNVPEVNALNLDAVYDRYLTTLQSQLNIEIENLFGKIRGLSIRKILEEGKPYLAVVLDEPSAVESIFSEGEIKAVALALLISDLELKQKKNPIVLDDPVNSLDNRIIMRFANRIINMPNQVILFTHNIWLTNAILKNNGVKVYKSTAPKENRTNTKKHVIPYMVSARGRVKGIVSDYEKDNPQYYLDSAKEVLDTNPFTIKEAESATQLLRKAVELLVDEKVFLGLEPCKYRFGAQGIQWIDLFRLKTVPEVIIQKLQEQFNLLSSGGTHLGMVTEENSLEHDDLEDVYNELIALM